MSNQTTDLVADLRSWVEEIVKPGSLDELLVKAADDIERKKALLRELREKSARVHPELIDRINRELST